MLNKTATGPTFPHLFLPKPYSLAASGPGFSFYKTFPVRGAIWSVHFLGESQITGLWEHNRKRVLMNFGLTNLNTSTAHKALDLL